MEGAGALGATETDVQPGSCAQEDSENLVGDFRAVWRVARHGDVERAGARARGMLEVAGGEEGVPAAGTPG